jgi:hypothetical protein
MLTVMPNDESSAILSAWRAAADRAMAARDARDQEKVGTPAWDAADAQYQAALAAYSKIANQVP